MGRAGTLFCFVISILFLLSSPFGDAIAAPPGPGALVNGDFESGAAGDAVGTGWTAFTSTGYGATFTVVSDQVHAGSLAQRVRSPRPRRTTSTPGSTRSWGP
jgi:multidrug efflux pump subunit AcrA (membrane-fusion protein)